MTLGRQVKKITLCHFNRLCNWLYIVYIIVFLLLALDSNLVLLKLTCIFGGVFLYNQSAYWIDVSTICLPVNTPFLDSNSKTPCPIEFKLDLKIDHHHS